MRTIDYWIKEIENMHPEEYIALFQAVTKYYSYYAEKMK